MTVFESTTLGSVVVPITVGLLGFAGGILSRIGKHWYETRIRRKKLRVGILAEIRSPEQTINELAKKSASDDLEFKQSKLPTNVYQSQIENIGLLSSDEVKNVVDYYSIAEVTEAELEKLTTNNQDTETDHLIKNISPGLKSARDDAEKVLEIHSKFFGKYRYKIRRRLGCFTSSQTN